MSGKPEKRTYVSSGFEEKPLLFLYKICLAESKIFPPKVLVGKISSELKNPAREEE